MRINKEAPHDKIIIGGYFFIKKIKKIHLTNKIVFDTITWDIKINIKKDNMFKKGA
ncbi:hypothetical protein HMPREF1049_1164 [Fusobacterium necrophorum subsp. funduliforme ATCC 51357]|nr:hypothetical protein HMPREF1049_1164 [Fusobacterium necrophorum subsp. funduliforme ATCC 51357]